MSARKFLVLGGTADAIMVAHGLASRFEIIYSLAGVTDRPRLPSGVTVRQGGFGGQAGFDQFCQNRDVGVILDCTHPFARRMSATAVQSGLPLFRLERPAWTPMRGDRWISVPHMAAASHRLRHQRGPIALALGKGGEPLAKRLGARGVLRRWTPQMAQTLRDPAAEYAWLRAIGARILVCKNSGGLAFAKLLAARRLALPVMMIQRPILVGGERFDDIGWMIRTVLHRYG